LSDSFREQGREIPDGGKRIGQPDADFGAGRGIRKHPIRAEPFPLQGVQAMIAAGHLQVD